MTRHNTLAISGNTTLFLFNILAASGITIIFSFPETHAQAPTPQPNNNTTGSVEQLQTQIANLQTQNTQLNKKISDLQNNLSRVQQLNMETTDGLTFLLRQLNPEIPTNDRELNIATISDLDWLWNCLVLASDYASRTGGQGFFDFNQILGNGCQQPE